ncbi:hypothetical protein G7046_g3594 [Stylonectria norvegica]|nr:hypothetical protein G7046_g3594 [Stylonectria norvegica]
MRYKSITESSYRALRRKQWPPVNHRILDPRKLFFSSTPESKLEEEKCPNYSPNNFYPARIGETLYGKYQLLSKLGWGTSSTVWLARVTSFWPWQSERFVALKITNCSRAVQKAARRELEVSKHMFSVRTSHPGRKFVRNVLDSFEVNGPGGKHLCLAFEPLRQPLWMLGSQSSSNGLLQPRTIKTIMPSILQCLDFLHSEYLKGDHFMVPFEDSEVLKGYVRRQEANPAPCKERNSRPVYDSRSNFGRMRSGVDFVKITDFGLAVRGDVSPMNNHDIQPQEYTAPEVMLKAGWTYSTDIWNLGLVMWELLADVNLLNGRAPGTGEFSDYARFAQMIRLLGPPPRELLSRADEETYSKFYDDQGRFNLRQSFSFESMTPMLDGEEKTLFIGFAKRMLAWIPGKRATAKELLDDPWLKNVQ